MLPYPVLLADVGGTYARFALLTQPAADPTPIWKVSTAGFPGPAQHLLSLRDFALLVPHGGIDAPLSQKPVMRPPLDDDALVEDQDLVRRDDGR